MAVLSILAALGLAWASTVGSGTRGSGAGPIAFTTVPQAAEGGPDRRLPIAGTVHGARPGQQIVLYAKSGVWFVQPFKSAPFTSIGADGSWRAETHLGTEYAALLVNAGYRPPTRIDALPVPGGAIAAVSATAGVGELPAPARKTLTFSGYDWEVRQTPSDRGGTNHFDPANVSLDPDGALRLRLVQRRGAWMSAEVKLTRSLGYGTYVFVVRDTADLDPAVGAGLLTWDEGAAAENFRELDIELGRWGDATRANAQFVVQPQYIASNVVRFTAPPGRLTHSFQWQPGRAAFRTVRGARLAASAPLVAEHEFTFGVPQPGNERVHMNLYVFRRAPSLPQKDVDLVIEKFLYLP